MLTDLVIPIADFGTKWQSLSRNSGQFKFNVRRDFGDLVLLIPGSLPISVKRYARNFKALG